MSELRRLPRRLTDLTPASHSKSRFDSLRVRLPYYIGVAILAVLALAWIDGGEEPIRPIVQNIDGAEQS
ncbi:MAG: hypothetical protein QNJ15_10720 [Erythrobacter sp.]|nr:hypothetical protein [Erythrobacter sp.]